MGKNLHGNNGTYKANFLRNVDTKAIGYILRVMLYPKELKHK